MPAKKAAKKRARKPAPAARTTTQEVIEQLAIISRAYDTIADIAYREGKHLGGLDAQT